MTLSVSSTTLTGAMLEMEIGKKMTMIEKLAGEPPHLGEQPRGEDRHHHNLKIIIITCRCKNVHPNVKKMCVLV